MRQDGSSMDQVVKRNKGLAGKVVLLIVLISLTGTAIYLYPSLSRWASADRSIDMTRLRFGTVVRGDLLRDVSVQGKIVAADRPTLVSPAQGVVSLLVKAGDVVSIGDVMARVESPELQNSLQQQRSIFLSMQSDLERQKITAHQTNLQNQQDVSLLELKLNAGERAMERARKLFEEGLGSSAEFEKARDEVRISELALAHAKEKAQLTRENMEFEIRTKELQLQQQQLVVSEVERKVQQLAVLAPVAGLVSKVDIRDKDTVQPAQALLSVVDLSRFEIEVLIPENFADEISAETPAMVHYEGKEYRGEVRSYSPEVEDSQVKGIVAFIEVPPSGLRQNQRVETRLILDSRANVLKIPRGPFLESLGGRQAYVVENGVATLKPIRVGSVSVTEVEITSGLNEGDEIVLSDLTRFEGADSILLRD